MDKYVMITKRKNPMTQFVDKNNNKSFGHSESKHMKYEKTQRKGFLNKMLGRHVAVGEVWHEQQ